MAEGAEGEVRARRTRIHFSSVVELAATDFPFSYLGDRTIRKSSFALALAFLAAIVWLGFRIDQPHAAENAPPAAKQWEYRVYQNRGDLPEGDLNALGKEGWENCGFATAPLSPTVSRMTLVFKREKK